MCSQCHVAPGVAAINQFVKKTTVHQKYGLMDITSTVQNSHNNKYLSKHLDKKNNDRLTAFIPGQPG